MAFDATIPLPECKEAFTRSILNDIAGPHILLDQDTRILAVNGEAGLLIAWHQDDIVGRPFSSLFAAADRRKAIRSLLNQAGWQADLRARSGARIPARFTRSLVQSTMGLRYLVSVREATAQRDAEDEPPAQKSRSQVAMDAVSDAILITDGEGTVNFSNRAARVLLDRTDPDLLGNRLIDILRFSNPNHNHQLESAIQQVLHRGGCLHVNESAELLRGPADTIGIDGKLVALCDQSGQITGCTAVIRDLSTERRMQAVLSFKASHDELTGLINRREFEHRLHELLLRNGTHREPGSVLIIDLDRFKLVNDSHGHMVGDLLLRQLTETLLTRIRGNDTLARIGGDRFAVLLPRCDTHQAKESADALHNAINDFRFTCEDRPVLVGASIGVVTVDREMFGPGDVVTAADAALALAKENGRDRIVVYQAEGPEEQRRRGEVLWANRIREALDKDRLRLYCQPIVPLEHASGRGWSCEILVRMLDEGGDLVPPMAFIPAAERYDLMPLVDRWVISAVTRQWQSNPDTFGGIEKCNINLSGQSLAQEGFLDFVLGQFGASGFPHHMACFEITETAVVANMANAQRLIHELSACGCQFALDDFGSGLSSFTYLKHLPVDYLKIDGSFVRDMLKDPMDAAMVRAIADIGHTLGLETIAEFVESRTMIAELNRASVDYAQGFGIQHPFPLDELIDYRPEGFGD